MPPVIAGVAAGGLAAAAGTSVGFTILGSTALASALVVGGTTIALGYASQALASSPATPEAAPLATGAGGLSDNVRQPITNWKTIYGQVRVGGAITFMHSTDSNNNLFVVLTLAGHPVEELGDIYLDDEVQEFDEDGNATGNKWAGYCTIVKGLGTTAGDADFNAFLQENCGDKWTTAHRQSGRAKLAIKWRYSGSVFPGSIPKISCVVKGKKVYDPRSGLTAWSDNFALCVRDYLTDTDVGVGATSAEINAASFIAAANVSDEDIVLSDASTQKRYTINGVVDTAEKPKDILGKLLTAGVGSLTYAGGQWHLFPATWDAPGITLTQADLCGPIKVQSRLSRREVFNAVKGTFVDPDQHWQPTDFPAVTNALYLSQDQDERIWRDVEYPFTNSGAAAQRLAKIELESARQQITVTARFKFVALRLMPGRTVAFTYARFGWTGKPFRIVSSTFAIAGSKDAPYLAYDLVLRETAAGVTDWANGEETAIDLSPDTDLPDPNTVAAPGVPSVSESLYETRDGAGVKALATMGWQPADDGFVIEYVPEYKLAAATNWTVLAKVPVVQDADNYQLDILDIAPGTYVFRVKARNFAGRESAYATSASKEIFGLGAKPAAITSLSLQALGGVALIGWDRHPDLDVRVGGQIRIRHTNKTAGYAWNDGVELPGPKIAGSATHAILPLVAGTYMVKAVDSGGNESDTLASATTAAATIFSFSTLSTVTEDPTFGGTKSSLTVASSTLKLDTSGGAVLSSGTYNFAAGIDLGSVKKVRLQAILAASVENVNTTVDSRTASIDDWADFDGSTGTSAQVDLYYRSTPDDPAGTPTWSGWSRFVVTDAEARGFEFKAEFTSSDPAYNINVTALSVSAQEI